MRGIGTGEVTNGPGGTSSGDGVLNTPDSIAYTFFSFGNVSKLGKSVKYGYLMIDGVVSVVQRLLELCQQSWTTGNPGDFL